MTFDLNRVGYLANRLLKTINTLVGRTITAKYLHSLLQGTLTHAYMTLIKELFNYMILLCLCQIVKLSVQRLSPLQ